MARAERPFSRQRSPVSDPLPDRRHGLSGREVAPASRSARRPRGRRSRASWRWRQAFAGLLLVGGGAGLLAALMQIPERLDALLLVSTAIANVIAGLSRLAVGVLQLGGVLLVVLLTLLALLLLIGGAVRIVRALAPAPPSHADAAATTQQAARRTTGR